MATVPFQEQFLAVAQWAGLPAQAAGFATCVRRATADPYIFEHTVIVLRAADTEVREATAGELGVDPVAVASDPARWREAFTSANAFAHTQGFFHGFPTFRRVEADGGAWFGVVLLRGTGAGPAGNGVTWRDVPAAEVFPEIPPGASGFLQLSGATWLRRVDAWATANGFGAALPTGWAAAPGGGWVVGVVLFEAAAVQRVPVSGEALGYHQELCAREANWSEPDAPETGSVTAIASADGIASPAPLAINEAPFGDPLFAEPGKVAYLRCVARRNGSAVIAVLAQGPDAVRLVMRPRQDSRRVVFFANSASKGAWIVAHRFNFSTNAGMGEVASFYRREGAGVAQAFDITTGTAGAGRVQAHTVGFVKQGLFGVALPIMSFSWSTFLGLSAGMDLTFTWVSP